MSLAEQHLLIDAANLALILFAVALLASRLPGLQAYVVASHPVGKVPTHAFGTPEFLTATVLILIFYFSAAHPEHNYAANFLILIVTGILIYLGAIRRHDLVELFGLERLTPAALWKSVIPWFLGSTLLTLAVMWGWQRWLTDLIGDPHPQEAIRQLQQNRDFGFRASVFITAAIFAPVTEEIFFRGFLYPAMKRFLQPVAAAAVVSAIFAVVHGNVVALVPLFVLSILLIAAYEFTGTLWVPILVHAGFNTLNIFFTIFASPAANG